MSPVSELWSRVFREGGVPYIWEIVTGAAGQVTFAASNAGLRAHPEGTLVAVLIWVLGVFIVCKPLSLSAL